MSKHLSSEEMDALLAGQYEAKGHREECEACSEEVDDLRRLLNGVRQSAVAVAEKQRSLALRASGSRLQPKSRLSLQAWALPIAAMLVVAVMAPVEMHRRHEAAVDKERTQAVASVAHHQQEQEQLADDEALLSKVQDDLSISVPQPLQPLTVTTTSTDGTTSLERTN